MTPEERFEQYEKWLAHHYEAMIKHENWLVQHNEALAKHEQWLAQHKEAQAKHEQWLAKHEEAIARHDEAITRHEEAFAGVGDLFREVGQIQRQQAAVMLELAQRVDALILAVERLRERDGE